jgi:hypothetical protein
MFNKYNNPRFTPNKILIYLVLFIAIASAISALVMLLWNAILPVVTGVKPLSFWQAAGLLLLSKIIFGGFSSFRNRKKHGGQSWKNKWRSMNPEERQEAKMRWKEHCRKRGIKKE